jgi:hypothetical protein
MVTGYLIVVGVLILAWSQFSRTGVLRILLRTILGLLALGAAASTLLLLYVGFKNSWTSDGPAMLLVMLGILVCGGLTYFFMSLTVLSLRLAAANDGDIKPDSEFENTHQMTNAMGLPLGIRTTQFLQLDQA